MSRELEKQNKTESKEQVSINHCYKEQAYLTVEDITFLKPTSTNVPKEFEALSISVTPI